VLQQVRKVGFFHAVSTLAALSIAGPLPMTAAVRALAPEDLSTVLGDRRRVIAALETAFACSDRTVFLEQAACRVAQLLQANLPLAEPDTATTEPDAAITAFVEQWVIDVASMSDQTVARVREILGDDGLMNFIHSLLVVEQRLRLELAWRRLGLLLTAEPEPLSASGHLADWGRDRASTSPRRAATELAPCTGRIAPGRHGDKHLTAALSEWQAAVVCLDQVDPITTELVRLRCANYHDCHT